VEVFKFFVVGGHAREKHEGWADIVVIDLNDKV